MALSQLFNWLFFRRITVNNVPQQQSADDFLNLCKGIINKSVQQLSTNRESGHYLINSHQCKFLVKRLSEILAHIQQSSRHDEKTSPVLQELHRVLLDVERVIQSSSITTSEWLRAAVEQGDMKETFLKLLHDVQWHIQVLQSILVNDIPDSGIRFKLAMCNGNLNPLDESFLMTGMKEDKKVLMTSLRSMKLDDPAERELADQLLSSTSLNLLTLDAKNLKTHLDGILLGNGSFGEVRETHLLGGKYAIKIFELQKSYSFDQEKEALQRLGYHPHIVRLLCYSRDSDRCFLIMEKMDTDLSRFLQRRKDNGKLSDVEAVVVMLQIAEGVRYIHSKRMAHRDLKPGNVLVNLEADPSRIRSLKIADFGLTKTKNASKTYADQTLNTGTTKYMAPEVIKANVGDPDKAEFNPKKADVYSFAIICSEILTGEKPYGELENNELKKQLKGSHSSMTRPNLPTDCPARLASLIRRCWDGDFHVRPEFDEICPELRYIKGLLLRGDQQELQNVDVTNDSRYNVESAQHQVPRGHSIGDKEGDQFSHEPAYTKGIMKQGPWGRHEPKKKTGFFDHMADSIKSIKLKYNQHPPGLGLMEVEYVKRDGGDFIKSYGDGIIGSKVDKIDLKPNEFIKRVSGSVAKHFVTVGKGKVGLYSVVSLTIHTNLRSHGPYGDELGHPFTSGTGKVIGFFGAAGALIDKLGIWIIPDNKFDGDQSSLITQ